MGKFKLNKFKLPAIVITIIIIIIVIIYVTNSQKEEFRRGRWKDRDIVNRDINILYRLKREKDNLKSELSRIDEYLISNRNISSYKKEQLRYTHINIKRQIESINKKIEKLENKKKPFGFNIFSSWWIR